MKTLLICTMLAAGLAPASGVSAADLPPITFVGMNPIKNMPKYFEPQLFAVSEKMSDDEILAYFKSITKDDGWSNTVFFKAGSVPWGVCPNCGRCSVDPNQPSCSNPPIPTFTFYWAVKTPRPPKLPPRKSFFWTAPSLPGTPPSVLLPKP